MYEKKGVDLTSDIIQEIIKICGDNEFVGQMDCLRHVIGLPTKDKAPKGKTRQRAESFFKRKGKVVAAKDGLYLYNLFVGEQMIHMGDPESIKKVKHRIALIKKRHGRDFEILKYKNELLVMIKRIK